MLQHSIITAFRLKKLALIDGFWEINPSHRVEALSGNWRSDVRRFTDSHGQQNLYDKLDISNIVERAKKRAGLRSFFMTQTIAACNSLGLSTNSLGLSTKPIIQITSTLSLLSDAIPTGDWSVCSGVVAMAYMLTQAALANIANIAAERTGSVLCACLAQ